jgi:hypothetical protein
MLRIVREPLLHFVAVGATLFALYSVLNRSPDNAAPPSQTIRVTVQDAEWLSEAWSRQRQRTPTHQELRGLVVDYVNEQLLAREARALGLDDNDTIVRRRLAQKLTFLLDDTLRRAEPTEAELQQLYESREARFSTGARISFTHVYFGPTRRANAKWDATVALAALVESGNQPAVEHMGDRSLLEASIQNETETAVSSLFGADFARSVFSLPSGTWSGPIESAYGLHLVYVSDVSASHLPPLSEIRERVADEWRREQEALAKEKYLAELRKKYHIAADEAVTSLLATPQVAKARAP